ncbi:hypothetical protein DESC_200014 [Desulfosarcina cetonica]|nr:hypothetical protein DESC_200014 [Desulfosarcina cetonica]
MRQDRCQELHQLPVQGRRGRRRAARPSGPGDRECAEPSRVSGQYGGRSGHRALCQAKRRGGGRETRHAGSVADFHAADGHAHAQRCLGGRTGPGLFKRELSLAAGGGGLREIASPVGLRGHPARFRA